MYNLVPRPPPRLYLAAVEKSRGYEVIARSFSILYTGYLNYKFQFSLYYTLATSTVSFSFRDPDNFALFGEFT